ncbi:MAG: hypothetical protein ACYDHT_00260 [Solirubrobacteraceae bacterium]
MLVAVAALGLLSLRSVEQADNQRAAIAAIRVGGIDKAITASAGVAVLPGDGGDAVTLFRAADRALSSARWAPDHQVRRPR